jgi:hypothetical protein
MLIYMYLAMFMGLKCVAQMTPYGEQSERVNEVSDWCLCQPHRK